MRATRVSFMGTRARKILREDWTGTVRSSHATGLYLRRDTGEVLLLHDETFGVIPFGLGRPVTGWNWQDVEPGTVAWNEAQNATLHMDGTALFHGAAATPESCLPDVLGPKPDRTRIASGLAMAESLLTPAHGVAALYLSDPAALFAETSPPPRTDDISEKAVWEPLRGLLAYCLFRSEANSPEGLASALVGLGSGLTPLADDVLCGLLAGGHALRRAFANRPLCRLTETIAPAVIKTAPGTTTIQSVAFLESAAAGEHFGMLDALVAAVYAEDAEKISRSLEAITNVGHSSGGGLLLGVLCAVRLALRRQEATGH